MPDSSGKLTSEEQQRAISWVNQKAPGLRCSACSHNQMAIAEHLFSPPTYHGGNIVIGGPSYPQFMLVCQRCGHMMGFSAIASGVIKG